jgi:hypothetical protein
MNAPATIGELWTPKRGHRDAGNLEIRMIHRADRAVTVRTAAGDRRTIPWRDLRRVWRRVEG